MAFTSLAYLMDVEWLKEAHQRTRKDGAVGVDGITAEDYEHDLEGNGWKRAKQCLAWDVRPLGFTHNYCCTRSQAEMAKGRFESNLAV